MMKVLVVGDCHGNEKFFSRACRVAVREGCSHILFVGDFGYWEHYSHGARFLAVAEYELAERGLEGWWIDGNHENHPLLWEKYGPTPSWLMDEDPTVKYGVSQGALVEVRPHLFYVPRGFRWEWEGTSFLACGGAYSIDAPRRTPGQTWWQTEMITNEQVDACIEGGHADVMITHDAPYGFQLPAIAFKDSFPLSTENRKQLGRIVEQVAPHMLIHGHYHHRYANWHTLENGPKLGKKVRIEGLGSDQDGDEKSWIVLEIEGAVGVKEAPVKYWKNDEEREIMFGKVLDPYSRDEREQALNRVVEAGQRLSRLP